MMLLWEELVKARFKLTKEAVKLVAQLGFSKVVPVRLFHLYLSIIGFLVCNPIRTRVISFLHPNYLISLFLYILFGAPPPGVVSTANNGGFTSIRTKVKCNDFSWLLTSVWYMPFWSLFWTISLNICWQMILYRILISLNHATICSVCSICPDEKTVKFL